MACWGVNDEVGFDQLNDPTSEPSMSFDSLSAGYDHNCGARGDGTVYCWGSRSWYFYHKAQAPENFYLGVGGVSYACGLTSAGTPVCWDPHGENADVTPPRRFADIDVGGSLACGIGADGAAACWDDDYSAPSPPDGVFRSVSAQDVYACGVRSDGRVVCWGYHIEPDADAMFKSVSAASRVLDSQTHVRACGIKADDTVMCWGWGDDVDPDETTPDGKFRSVSVGFYTCGVRTNGTLECWDVDDADRERVTPPAGDFRSVSVADGYACGLKTNDRVVCWGWTEGGREAPPYFRFQAVSAGPGPRLRHQAGRHGPLLGQ